VLSGKVLREAGYSPLGTRPTIDARIRGGNRVRAEHVAPSPCGRFRRRPELRDARARGIRKPRRRQWADLASPRRRFRMETRSPCTPAASPGPLSSIAVRLLTICGWKVAPGRCLHRRVQAHASGREGKRPLIGGASISPPRPRRSAVPRHFRRFRKLPPGG